MIVFETNKKYKENIAIKKEIHLGDVFVFDKKIKSVKKVKYYNGFSFVEF